MAIVAAIIVAGGSGRRMLHATPKQYLQIRGRPVLRYAVDAFLSHPGVSRVVLVVPPADTEAPPTWLRELDVTLVAGGVERGDSVWNGLRAVGEDAEVVLIHDGARPFVSRGVIDRVLAAAPTGGAIAAVPVADTIKEVDGERGILGTPDRSRLWQAQTPQGFPRDVILRAHEEARRLGIRATDDASLVERLGMRVTVVEGASENLKITRPSDLLIAEALAQQVFGA